MNHDFNELIRLVTYNLPTDLHNKWPKCSMQTRNYLLHTISIIKKTTYQHNNATVIANDKTQIGCELQSKPYE